MPKHTKAILSPGQGLLILIDYYKKDPTKSEQLKKLYLSGAQNKKDDQEIRRLLKDTLLADYQISYDKQIINNDPTRRYFETHLAYESLKNGLVKLNKNALISQFESLKNLLPANKLAEVVHILSGEFKESDNNLFKEYSDYVAKIKSGKIFEQLLPDDREKIELLAKCSFLAVINAQSIPLPLNIYGTGMYSENSKGKIIIPGQESTRNHHLGLMKGHMPLALDDIARSPQEIPYLKPSDQATYVDKSRWVEANFNKLVHPFSNSISGTVLCQLRVHAKLKNEGQSAFTHSAEDLAHYNQLLISTMLFNSGGHSLNEFTAPLSLDEVRKEFKSIKGFEKTTLESMYLTNNKDGFNTALDETVAYNKAILLKADLRAQITGTKSIEPKNDVLKNLKITQEGNHLDQETINLSQQFINIKKAYEKRVISQYNSSSRTGVLKNVLIQNALSSAIKQMDNGNLIEAQTIIKTLKQDIVRQFGKTNFWGQKSESFKLVEDVEHELAHIHDKTLSFKQALKENKSVVAEKEKETLLGAVVE